MEIIGGETSRSDNQIVSLSRSAANRSEGAARGQRLSIAIVDKAYPGTASRDLVISQTHQLILFFFTAPGGQPYWFNPATNVSTYTRPLPPPPPGFPIAGAPPPPAGFPLAQQPPSRFAAPLHFTPTNGAQEKAKKEKKEKPKEKLPIEGTSWIRVTTNKGNVFYNNKDTKESLWTVPEDIKEQVEALEKKEQEDRENADLEEKKREEEERIVARKRKADDDSGNGANGNQKETDTGREELIDEAENREDEQEKGNLDIEIEGAVEGASSAVPTESRPDSATTPAPSKDEPPKKKKPKNRVVSSIEELETEDWQRQMAEQMAKEAEESEAREKKEMEEAMKPDVVVKESEKVEKLEVNQVEAAALYKVSYNTDRSISSSTDQVCVSRYCLKRKT